MELQTIPVNWHQHAFRAMGCQMTIWLEAADESEAWPALSEAEMMFVRAERVLSRFDPFSELSRLNHSTGRWIPVSALLWTVIAQALVMADETDGLFDPTQLNALLAAGYDRSFDHLAGEPPRPTGGDPVATPGQWQAVALDAETQAVWLPPGLGLDLGGIAKGYTAQLVVDFLGETGPSLVDASGDICAGAAPAGWPGWPVGLRAPGAADSGVELLSLWLAEGSMATSGIDYRRWQRDGEMMHHLMDPRTGRSAQTDLLTVTVLAHSAVRAEAWATAALVAGSSSAFDLLAENGLAAALVDQHHELQLTPLLAPAAAANAVII